MSKVSVIYGSNTGNTQSAAFAVAEAFGVSPVNIEQAEKEDFSGDLILLGSSTWGFGELQDSWSEHLNIFDGLDLSGKKAAVFGTGDQNGFSDTFCDALAILAEKLENCGAQLVGATESSSYRHSGSLAEKDGMFCGLALDCDNEPEKTASRIAAWIEGLKKS